MHYHSHNRIPIASILNERRVTKNRKFPVKVRISYNRDLKQRIIFLRQPGVLIRHLPDGYMLTPEGWRLSLVFDINQSIDKEGLALNIDNNSLDIELAKSVFIEYFIPPPKIIVFSNVLSFVCQRPFNNPETYCESATLTRRPIKLSWLI